MQDFKNLKVWQKSHDLTLKIYKATLQFPKEEIYGLTSQIRRAGVSIPSNIVEGCGRNTDSDFGRFLNIAMGSANELEYQLYLARDLAYLKSSEFEQLLSDITEIKRMLNTFIQKLIQLLAISC